MKPLFAGLITLALAGCTTYEPPSSRIVPIPEPEVKNMVDSIPGAAEVTIGELIGRNKITQRIRVAFMPVDNAFLDAGVSASLRNTLLNELVASGAFEVLKDIDLETVRRALAMEHGARAYLDDGAKVDLGRRLGADAVITCTVSDAIQYWNIQVDLTPLSSNVVAASGMCNLPKRIARRSQIYQP